MAVTRETLRRMLKELGGLELTEDELDRVLPHVQNYAEQAGRLRHLDLSEVLSSRLLRADEEDQE